MIQNLKWSAGLALLLGAWVSAASASPVPDPIPVLKRSDVVFMYQAPRETYRDYGATVLAWGGTPNAKSLEAARDLKFFGSVGMVTEFSRYYERFPTNYAEGLCRDLEGNPYKVPWLVDHQHKGIPYWWCCTRQPLFRTYISERVLQTVKAGAYGVHIDDHLGTAGSLWQGGCFCQRCMVEFRDHLSKEPAPGVANPETYDFPKELKEWLAGNPGRKFHDHPLWPKWRSYQLRGAAGFMAELRALAHRTAGKSIPMSANACLLWGPHLNDFHSLDFFSAEIEHHARSKAFSDAPVVAYRMADAVGRPLASTASGGDWAFIKEQNLPGLVQGWIALGYACGNSIMAPNRQWCHTPEKGTHWYDGPKEKFAPLYRFVHEHPELFDGFETLPDVAIAYAQKSYDRDPGKLMRLCEALSRANLSFTLALGGDEVVVHPLPRYPMGKAPFLHVLDEKDFSPSDRALLTAVSPEHRVANIEDLMTKAKPAVRVPANVRAFSRSKEGEAVVHVINWDYDAGTDSVRVRKELPVALDLDRLGVGSAPQVSIHRVSLGATPEKVPVSGGKLVLEDTGLWSIIHIRRK